MDRCHLVSSLSFLHLLLRLILLQECDTSYHCLFIHLVYLDTSSDTLKQWKRELAPQMLPELLQVSTAAAAPRGRSPVSARSQTRKGRHSPRCGQRATARSGKSARGWPAYLCQRVDLSFPR